VTATVTASGGRVLGCLVEKELTTPQQYPLSLNALTLACSQSTNREPVMALDEVAVQRALQKLKELRLVRFVLPSHGKSVTRFRHVLDEAYGLDRARVALLAVLLLRGPQTPGELRSRSGRMAEFDSLEAIQSELEMLAGQPEPLVHLLVRQPGQKEDRWQQLLAAESSVAGPTADAGHGSPGDSDEADGPDQSAVDPGIDRGELQHRVATLESELAAVRSELGAVSASLDALRRSLGE
jgi:uncharacterized protein